MRIRFPSRRTLFRGFRIEPAQSLRFRCKVGDAHHRAVLRGHLPARTRRGIGGLLLDARRRRVGSPDIDRPVSRPQRVGVNRRSKTVGDDDGLARCVMPGDDAPDASLRARCNKGHKEPVRASDWTMTHRRSELRPYRPDTEFFCADSRETLPCASMYESTAAASSLPKPKLGIAMFLYFAKSAMAVGSPSASIRSGSAT